MSAIERAWEEGGALATLLRPLGALYRLLAAARASGYRRGWLPTTPSPLPVVVVGNLGVGGTGKTPLTAHLVGELRRRGWRPGVVSRGYGGARQTRARHVRADDRSSDVGDEPLMMHRLTGAPVCVCVRRSEAVAALARDTDCDVVLSDDGLQHLAMARDVEIVVVDGARGVGNGRSLPAGPLRDPPSRLAGVDLIAVREQALRAAAKASSLADVPGLAGVAGALPPAFRFALVEPEASRWPDGDAVPLATFAGQRVHAVAGIARPERFFSMLRAAGLDVDGRALVDHQPIAADDLRFDDDEPVLVTRKDAARLDAVAPLPAALHVVDVRVALGAEAAPLLDALSARLRTLGKRRARGEARDGGKGVTERVTGARGSDGVRDGGKGT